MDQDINHLEQTAPHSENLESSISTETIDYPQDYVERMKLTLAEIEKIRRTHDKLLKIGDAYCIKTPRGDTVMIESMYIDYVDKSNVNHRKYYLVAQNINGQILGDRTTDIRQLEFQGDRYALAEGMTATGKRGSGISTTIETTHLDMLARESHRIGKRIDWHVSNRNKEDLQDLQEEFRLNPTEEINQKITNKKEEQKRWQSVYGPNGRLGFGDTGVKSFSPNEPIDKYSTESMSILSVPSDTELYEIQRESTIDRIVSRMKKIADNKG